jgi:hypothetical protein
MLSAPATIPATNDDTFAGAFADPGPDKLRQSPTRSTSPARDAKASTGTRPADDTRFGSSKTADTTGKV